LGTGLYDGYYNVAWKNNSETLPVVYIITDAPAHGEQYWNETGYKLASEWNFSTPAGYIEELVGLYCTGLGAKVYLLDLLHNQKFNLTGQMWKIV